MSWYWRIAMWFQGPVLLGRMERPAGRSCYPSTFFFSVLLACKLYYSYVNSTNTLGQHKFSKKKRQQQVRGLEMRFCKKKGHHNDLKCNFICVSWLLAVVETGDLTKTSLSSVVPAIHA